MRFYSDLSGIPSAILTLQNGTCLFIGKITAVNREVRVGFTVSRRTTIRALRLLDK
jgi:DUF917 family protein